ncbi:MAG: divalent cation tolerance protein CutA, partial [Propionibacteriaceae bacterium]|nr:divalent cation tolerance protein CutA [Propionibacteriaceae bacterium]
TRSIHVPAIIEAVKARHPYDVPGIIATTLTNASPQYAAWIIASTLDKPTA